MTTLETLRAQLASRVYVKCQPLTVATIGIIPKLSCGRAGFPSVVRAPKSNKFQVTVCDATGKTVYLGSFIKLTDAIRTYNDNNYVVQGEEK